MNALAPWLLLSAAYIPPEQYRHEQLTAMQAAFSRFGGHGDAPTESIAQQDIPDFLRYVVASMNSAALPEAQIISRSTELTQQLMPHLPPKPRLSLEDILRGTERIIKYPQPAADELESERGRLGSKQLRMLRRRLERNRLTMPLFDTRGWVRDFEKALKIQWEIYANGLSPMHIVVARSDHLYGTKVIAPVGSTETGDPA